MLDIRSPETKRGDELHVIFPLHLYISLFCLKQKYLEPKKHACLLKSCRSMANAFPTNTMVSVNTKPFRATIDIFAGHLIRLHVSEAVY